MTAHICAVILYTLIAVVVTGILDDGKWRGSEALLSVCGAFWPITATVYVLMVFYRFGKFLGRHERKD